MSISTTSNQNVIKYPKYLFILMLSYAMFVLISNWYDSRLIEVFGVSMTPGALIYSLTFLQADMITEVYGFKNARIAILYALLFNSLFVIYGWGILHLPTPSNITTDVSFNDFLAKNSRIIIASFIGYFTTEPLNSFLVAKLKIALKGKYMGFRFIFSSLISGFFDTMLFMPIAFYGAINNAALIKLAIHVWLIKAGIEILFAPLSIRIAKKLKQIDQIDIYDTNTKFNIFSLDTTYSEKDNKYNESKF